MSQEQVINAGRDAKNIKQVANKPEKNWIKIAVSVITAIGIIIVAIIGAMSK